MSTPDAIALRLHRHRSLAAGLALLVTAGLWHASLDNLRVAARERYAAARIAGMVEGVHTVEPFLLPDAPRPAPRAGPASRTAWRLFAAGGRRVGYVVPFEGPGFQRPISGAVAVDAQRERILAVAVHESHESPAEDLFERHPWFLDQLAKTSCRAPVSLVPAPAEGAHAITGASISSHVFVRLVNDAVAALRAAPAEER